jgi:DNA-binding MarR family transcriptional regulator
MVKSDIDLQELAAALRTTLIPLARQLRQGDFTPTQSSVIGTIDRLQPVTIGELAAAEKLSLPVVSRIITHLERSGAVVREVRSEDRRVQWISLTEAFAIEIKRARSERNAELAAQLKGFSRDDIDLFEKVVPLLHRLMAPDSPSPTDD